MLWVRCFFSSLVATNEISKAAAAAARASCKSFTISIERVALNRWLIDHNSLLLLGYHGWDIVSEIGWCFLDFFSCLMKERPPPPLFIFKIIFIIFLVVFVQLVFLSIRHLQMHVSIPDEFSSAQNTPSNSNIPYSIVASLTFKN